MSWLTHTSMEIQIGGKKRKISMTPTTNIPGLNTPCLFKGKVEGDLLSEVSVSGCHDSSNTMLTMASSLLPGGVVDLSLDNGITQNIKSDSIAFEETEGSFSEADYLFPPKDPFQIGHAWSGPFPSKVVLKTNIKYDNSLLGHFGYSHTRTKYWIDSVVQLAKPRMFHGSLSIRVVLEIGEVSHIDETLKATSENIRYLAQKGIKPLTSYFCKDIGGGVLGIAYVGSACHHTGYAVNINELYSRTSPDLKTAREDVTKRTGKFCTSTCPKCAGDFF